MLQGEHEAEAGGVGSNGKLRNVGGWVLRVGAEGVGVGSKWEVIAHAG